MNNEFKQQTAKIAHSKRPFALVFEYSTGGREQNDVLSTHSTHALAEKAARASGYDTFLAVQDAREYV
jgi:hypothetical protein